MADVKNFAVHKTENLLKQVEAMAGCEAYRDSVIRIMPDGHPGKGAVVGSTITYGDKIVPSTVGVDIACRVSLYRLPSTVDFEKLDEAVHQAVPAGFNVQEREDVKSVTFDYTDLRCWGEFSEDEQNRIRLSMGTLGGGNHMIAVDEHLDHTRKELLIHCGSRSLGVKVADHYTKVAMETHGSEGEYAYVSGQDMEDYLHDMDVVKWWTKLNHDAIYENVASRMGWAWRTLNRTCVHNYVDTEDRVIRKGAISAHSGELGIIPLNMRDGVLVVKGRGDDDWNRSLPHGAGRVMSRHEARKNIGLDEYVGTMRGVYSSTVNEGSIDEAPMAYNDWEAIARAIEPNALVVDKLLELYNFKDDSKQRV